MLNHHIVNTFVQKADLALSELTTSGGVLTTEQARAFVEIAILESVLLGIITTKPMGAPSLELNKIGFTGRVLRGATENTALAVADRSKPELGRVTLTSKKLIADVRIPFDVVEDNIEQGNFVDHVKALLAKAVSRDLELLFVQGDTTSTDALLKQLDGVLKQATSYVYAAGGVKFTKTVLETMVKTMPAQYFVGAPKMAILTSKNAAIDYTSSVANRQTPAGDTALTKASTGEFMGMGIVPIPVFPENQGVGSNTTSALLVDPKNIHFGIQREITIMTQPDAPAQELIVVATLRADVKYAHEPAVVKATQLLAT